MAEWQMAELPAWALAFNNALINEEERLQCLVELGGDEEVKQVVLKWQRLLGNFLTPQALREGIRKDVDIRKAVTYGTFNNLPSFWNTAC